jgi:signal transduction histidine kinase
VVELDRVDGSARLVLEDDGRGILAGDRERVFERFARLDEGRSRGGGGVAGGWP